MFKKKCPRCNKSLVKIVYGMPTYETFKKAEAKKVFIGGCIISPNNPTYHCYECKKSYSKDLKDETDVNNDWLYKNNN